MTTLAFKNSLAAIKSSSVREMYLAAQLVITRSMAVFLQLLVQIVVTSLAGPSTLGALQLFTAWSLTLGEFLSRGQPMAAMKLTAVAIGRGEVHTVSHFLRKAALRTIQLAMIMVVLIPVMIGIGINFNSPRIGVPLTLLLSVLLAAPVFAMIRLLSESCKGAGASLPAIWIENTVFPVSVLIAATMAVMTNSAHTQTIIIFAGVIGFLVSMILLFIVIRKTLAQSVSSKPTAKKQERVVTRNETRWFWIGGLMTIFYTQLPFFILPYFSTLEQTGYFSVAHKLVNVVTTILMLLAAILGPAFARASADSNTVLLRKLLFKSQVFSLGLFVPLALMLILLREQLPGIFGLETGQFERIMLILLVGQLVNAATGLPGLLLHMSGKAKMESLTLALTISLTLMAAYLQRHSMGLEGIAWLLSVSIALKNLATYFMTRYLVLKETSNA